MAYEPKRFYCTFFPDSIAYLRAEDYNQDTVIVTCTACGDSWPEKKIAGNWIEK